MKELKKIYLVCHPIYHLDRPESSPKHYVEDEAVLFEKWKELIIEEGQDKEKGICLLLDCSGPKTEELKNLALEYFEARCVMPDSNLCSEPDIKILLAEDLQETLKRRGSYRQWIPYEMWSSVNARIWSEDFRRKLRNQGYHFDPETVEFESCGASWGGCVTKYSVFMGRYLELSNPIKPNAELSLIPLRKGYPPRKSKFIERIAMEHHVWLFLFEGEAGGPVAQFLDGLRGIWEFPHVVTVSIDPQKVDVEASSPNANIELEGEIEILEDEVIVDVGDGCHPSVTTLIGKDISFGEFKETLVKAKISDRNK
jgi:hypothetical protein